jgi:CheY-like chemotaxis protein
MDGTFLLIADNDPFSRSSLSRFFSANGFQVATVSNGLECATELVERGPDVLAIALEIPWGGGDGVIARLGVSKERIRQIEGRALGKLRAIVVRERLPALAGACLGETNAPDTRTEGRDSR